MIMVSAGHHPYRKGASFNGFYEYDEAALWVPEIVRFLNGKGMAVPAGKLPEKVAFINSHDADMAVEVHFNSAMIGGEPIGKGCETLYCPSSARGKALAQQVQDAIAPLFPPSRGIKEGWYQMNKDKGPDYFLVKTKCPAIIVEPEFIHRKEIIQRRRMEACEAIAGALLGAL